MSDNAVVWSSAPDLAARIRQKDVSPVEVTEAILGRIAALNPRLNAFCFVAADQARAAALDAEVAVAVGRLRAAGAIVLGKTTTSEFGHKAVTESPLFGITRNPWDLTRTPGGSSGGAAAAVASGLGPIALGTDGGGSLRIPAAFCGVYGFKPSWGRVPQHPSFPG